MRHVSSAGPDDSEPDGALGKEDEIEITPEMIEAGVFAVSTYGDNLSFRDLGPDDLNQFVRAILLASLSVKMCETI
jgi:hypothetical protein